MWIGDTERRTLSERSSGRPSGAAWGTTGTGVDPTSAMMRNVFFR